MFKLEEFVLKTILGMIGNEPTYKIMQYSLGWYQKDVLNDENMTNINVAIEAYEISLIPEEPVTDDSGVVEDNIEVEAPQIEETESPTPIGQ